MGTIMHTAIDRRLLKAAAKFASPEELSEAVNGQLSPAQAIDRVKVLLASTDVYTEIEQRRLLLLQMADFVSYLKEQAQGENNPQAWAALNRGFKLLSDQLELSSINVDDVSTKLAKSHADYFISGFVMGFEKILESLNERLDGEIIDGEEVKELTEIGATVAAEYVEKFVMEEQE